jgi:hypothetical protein
MDQSSFNDTDRRTLLRVAADSIAEGLGRCQPLAVDPAGYAPALQEIRATFVTLQINQQLRGCIGMLQASRPLVVDVANNAFAAAFRDPRFTPVTLAEQVLLQIHISILSPAAPMTFTSERDLISQIRAGIDGLILEDGQHRGTFLPSVWESLPDAQTFLMHLKRKAGLTEDYWSATNAINLSHKFAPQRALQSLAR